jgi:phage tail-like protein
VRKNVSIQVLTPDMTEIRRWQFKEAFPVKWSGPSLQTTGNSIAVESLELAHEGFLT